MPAQQRSRITRRAVVVALLAATAATGAVFLIKQDDRGASAAGGTDVIVGGCAVKGPGWGQDKLRASYACPSVCGGTCADSRSWTKTGGEDWKGCAWVSIHPLARCKVWGEEPGEEGQVLAATACPDSCA